MRHQIANIFTPKELTILRSATRCYSKAIDTVLKEADNDLEAKLDLYGKQCITDQLLAKLSNAKVLNDDEE